MRKRAWLAPLPWHRIRPVVRLATGALILLALLASAVQIVATLVVRESFLASRLQRALAAADSSWRVAVDEASPNILGRSLRISGVRLVRRTQTTDTVGMFAGGGDSVFLPHVRLKGVEWIPLVRSGDLRAGGLLLTAPYVRVASLDDLFDSPQDDRGVPARIPPPRSAARIRLDSVQVTGGTLISESRAGSRGGGLRLGLGSLSLRHVAIGPRAWADTTRILLARAVDLRILGLGWQSRDSLSSVAAGPIRISSPDSLLVVEGFRLAPPVPDERFFRALEYRIDRRRISIRRTRAVGFDVRRLVREGAIVARAVELDSLRVDFLSDRRIPPRPVPAGGPKGWHRLRFDRYFRLDTVRLSADVSYAERHEEGSRPGRVSFERLSATAYNVTNDDTRTATSEPAIVNAETWLYGASRARVTFRVPLASEVFRISFEGAVGKALVRDFNALTVPLEGVRIESGAVDTVWFRVDIMGDTATGTASGIYRDFAVKFVDRDSGEGTVFKDIKSWFVNWLVVDGDNERRDDRPLRVGTIARSIDRDDTIFEVIWKPLRSGLLDLAGL